MTAPKPQQPETLWVDLLIHWAAVEGLPDPPEPFHQLLQGSLVYRQEGLWTYHPDNPPGLIEHVINEATGQIKTTVELQPPTAEYQDFPTATLTFPKPRKWKPYDSGTHAVEDPNQNPTDTTCVATFLKQSPAARVPEALAATPGVTGPWKDKVVERRPWGPRARDKAAQRDRPTARQQQINSDYQTAAVYWSQMQIADKQAWRDAFQFDRTNQTAFNLYLACAIGRPSDKKHNLERRIGRHLPTPNDP